MGKGDGIQRGPCKANIGLGMLYGDGIQRVSCKENIGLGML